jgi:hypothetical protein
MISGGSRYNRLVFEFKKGFKIDGYKQCRKMAKIGRKTPDIRYGLGRFLGVLYRELTVLVKDGISQFFSTK